MLLTVLLFILILGVIVFFHELGHFLTAKKFGMGVDEFGFGFPPRIFGVRKVAYKKSKKGKWIIVFGNKNPDSQANTGSTIYSLNWIPIGGFVKIKGEQGDKKEDADSFSHKKIWQRATVLSAGVGMNFIFAFLIITIGFTIGLPSIIDGTLPTNAKIQNRNLQIVEVSKDTPAANTDLKVGDIIKSIDGQQFIRSQDFQNYTQNKASTAVEIVVQRGNDTITKQVDLAVIEDSGKNKLGVWLAETGIVSYPWYHSIWVGLKTTISLTWQIIGAVFDILKSLMLTLLSNIGLVQETVSPDVLKNLAGPVGIAVLTGQVAKMGFIYILQFAALLSINLAIINFLPFPALDGGRVLFLIIEKIKGRPINQKIESIIHTTGFFVLIGLVLLVTVKDISRFSESIKNFFSSLF